MTQRSPEEIAREITDSFLPKSPTYLCGDENGKFINITEAIAQAIRAEREATLPSDEQKAQFIKDRIEWFEDGDEVDLHEYLNDCVEWLKASMVQSAPYEEAICAKASKWIEENDPHRELLARQHWEAGYRAAKEGK